MAKSTCSIDGCDRPAVARGWCRMHYRRWETHGDAARDPTRQATMTRETLSRLMALETDECVLWPHARTQGYGVLRINQRNQTVHVLACEATYGPRPTPGHEAAHSCGVRSCMNRRHLRWATYAENNADKLIHGTHGRGTRSKSAKLTENDVRTIRTLYSTGTMQKDLAAMFGVSKSNIHGIVHRRLWFWLDAV